MEIRLDVERREETGKGPARRMRASGYIPGVVYGQDLETQSIKVKSADLREVMRTGAGRNVLVDLRIGEDDGSEDHLVMIKEIQKHPYKEKILHVDFYKVAREQKIKVMVPVVLAGESIGVKEGGVLQHNLWEVEVECLPGEVPQNIEVDISELVVGRHLVVGDIKRVPGVEILNDQEDVLVSVLAPRLHEEEVAEEELAEEEEMVEEEAEGAPEAEAEEAEEGGPEKTSE